MGFYSWLVKAGLRGLRRKAEATGRSGPLNASWEVVLGDHKFTDAEELWGSLNDAQRQQVYKNHAVIYACVRLICTSFHAAPIQIGTESGSGFKPIENHPVLDVLYRPNSMMSYAELMEYHVGHLLLTGKSYIWEFRDPQGNVAELWPIPSHWVKIVPLGRIEGQAAQRQKEDRRFISHYEVQAPGAQRAIRVSTQDMTYVRFMDPTNFLEGVGPLQACYKDYKLDIERANYLVEMMNNLKVPGMIVKQQEEFTKEEREELKAVLENVVGRGKRGSPLFLWGEGAGVEMVAPLKDLDWPGLSSTSESHICCVPGTKIVTKRGVVNIESVTEADEVMTHKGRWRRVSKVMSRTVSDGVACVSAKGLESLRVTGNHPVCAARYGQVRSHGRQYKHTEWVDAAKLIAKRTKNQRGDFHAATIPVLEARGKETLRLSEWVKGKRFSTFEHGEKLKHTHPMCNALPKEVGFTEALGRLVGYYLAEGTAWHGQVRFSFSEKETDYVATVQEDLKTVFGVDSHIEGNGDCHTSTVVCQNAMLCELFDSGRQNERIVPEWAWAGGKRFFAAMLAAWVNGDGNRDGGRIRVTTASESLAWGMRLVAILCGKEASVRQFAQKPSKINGRPIRESMGYVVSWNEANERRGSYRIDGPHLTTTIQSVEEEPYQGQVFNLEVEEDQSYLTTGGTVHNCAAFGVPPLMVHVRVAQENSPLSSPNLEAAEQVFFRTTMTSLWLHNAYALTRGLIQNEGYDERLELRHDLSDVKALQEDMTKTATVVATSVNSGVMQVNEGRERLGLTPDPKLEGVYLIPMGMTHYKPGQEELLGGNDESQAWDDGQEENGDENGNGGSGGGDGAGDGERVSSSVEQGGDADESK